VKRLLWIVLFVGAALALLYWIDKQIEEPPVPLHEPTPEVPSGPANETQGMQFGGPTLFTKYDETTKRAAWILRSQDTETETDASGVTGDVLSGVTLELFGLAPEPAAGKDVLQARFTAARAHLVRLPDQLPTQPRWEESVRLEDVEVELLRGLALAPLTFHAPSAIVDLRQPLGRRVTTDEAFTANSPDLTVEGRGLDGQLDLGTLVIAHAGKVVLNRAVGAPATFAVRGDAAMQVRREGSEHGPVVLEAKDGAVIEPGAQNPGKLTAEHVVLRAKPDAAGELALERLDADGAVDWTAGDSRFQGRTLAATFGADARLEHARLEDDPSAELVIALTPGVLPSVQSKEERRVTIHGRDSLDITWRDDGYELVIEGPPEDGVPNLATQDFTLRSASRIDGWLSADQSAARFHAAGGVAITGGPATLETADFTVELAPDASGQTVLIGTATGSSRLEGTLPAKPGESEPRTFTLASPDGLKLERSARGWRVIESTHVDVAMEGADAFTARADRVHDFVVPESASGALEPGGLRFTAEGAVAVEFASGRFGGESLEVFALEPVPHFVVRGTNESKAFFRGTYGEARALEGSALEIERTGDTLTMRGAVTGSGEFPDGRSGKDLRVSFGGDELVLDRAENELLPGERLRTLRMTVTGHVQGSLSSDEQTLVMRCQRFEAENRVRLVDGKDALELGSLFIAEGGVHADILDQQRKSDLTIDCERFEVERTQSDVEANFRQFVANGNVRFQGRFGEKSALDFGGEGEVFVYDADRHGTLEAGPYGRVTLFGRSPEQMPFRLTAARVDFELTDAESLRLFAEEPELRTLGLRARAQHLSADDQSGVVLSGAVRASGATAARMPFTLDADEIALVGRLAGAEAEASAEDQLDSLTAHGHVDFRLSEGLRARGERLSVRRTTGILRLDGAPATFEFGGARMETEWVEFDPVLQVLVGTGRGRMLGEAPAATTPGGDDWSVDFLSASTLLELDSVVLVIQEPVFHTAQFESALRASWAILWLNREAFQDSERRDQLLSGLQSAMRRMQSLRQHPTEVLSIFREAGVSNLLREIYFEGPVEVLSEGELLARADAIYLDAASQLGWLARATVNMGGQFMGQRQEKMIVKADWLRLSSDGELRADRATVTSCTFDEPHVSVVTGNLKIEPIREPGKAHYQLRMEDNRVELYGKLRIPLPTIDFATDEELQPILPTLSLANSARFGTLFSFAFTRPADAIGNLFDKLVRSGGSKEKEEPPPAAEAPEAPGTPAPKKPRSKVKARYKIDGSYLGSRGGLLDLGLEIEAKDDYWFDLYVGLVGDTGTDRGFVRVPEDERDTLRRWVRSQAYFDHGKSAWSFSYSDQSDAGVQSEFFESQFLRYERAETYVQWRRSEEEYFVQATAKLRVDDFRTDIEELPSVSAYRGRSPLFSLGPLTFLHTGDASAEYLRRRVGTVPQSPFEPPTSFDDTPTGGFGTLDGLGEREVLRADTTQGLELPVVLGAGWKLTPFVSGRATAWSEGIEESDTPSRVLAEGGARLGATFWMRGANGKLNQLAPFAEYRSELAREDDGGDPVIYDDVERVVSGDFLRFGTRGRFGADVDGSLLDLDLMATHASARSDGRPDGWLPLEVFGRLVLQPAGQEFEIFHDGRYDLETQRTVYSLLSFGTHFGEEWGLQFSHQRGLDSDMQPLFEAASVSGLYRWTEKWEFEARQSYSLLENDRLDTRLGLRRYAHDLVFELDTSYREGEGSSIGISVKPRFGYHPPRVGYVPW